MNPDEAEVCDGYDNNCDGNVDEGSAAPTTYYTDADGDGYSSCVEVYENCSDILTADPSSQSGVYTINPTGTNPVEVYCDMTTD
jgi:hypothetical protein